MEAIMSIKPLHDRILVKRLEVEEKTAGGIIIPDNAKEKPTKGEVIEVGTGTKDEKGNNVALDVKKGDIVLFAKWGGTEINPSFNIHRVKTSSNCFCTFMSDSLS
jgi:chaperonin GroES